MARGYFHQTSFLGGERGPLTQGRADEATYYNSLNLCLNYVPVDEGAAVRRSGARFSAHAKNNSGFIRLVPFVSESQDALILEMTAGLVRFHRRGTLLTDDSPPEVVSISAADPAVVTTDVAHGWAVGDTVVFTPIAGVLPTPLRNKQFQIATVPTSTSFTIRNTGPLGTATVDGSLELNSLATTFQLAVERVTERTLPYTDTELADVKYTEEADRLFLFHPSHPIHTIDRNGLVVTSQSLSDGPYLDQNATATTLGFSGVTGSITVTASSVVGVNGGEGFQTTDVGRVIRVNSGTETEPNWTWLLVTARASTTSVTATVSGPDLAATTAVTTWRLGLYGDTLGHPAHGVIHEGRLFLVGGAQSGRIDGSVTFDFFNFEPTSNDGTVADNNGVTGVFAGSGRQNTRWLDVIETGLLIGTDGGEYVVRASSFDDPITPFSLQVRRHTTYGAANRLPVRAGRHTLFIQDVERNLIKYQQVGNGQYDGSDIARKDRTLTAPGLTELAYAKVPVPIVWALRNDRRLVGVTFRDDVEGEIEAWHRHSVEYAADVAAGEDATNRYLRGGGSRTNGTVHTIAAAPFSDREGSRNDNLWIAVDREGTTCVEYITPLFDASFAQNEGNFVDSGNVYLFGNLGIDYEQVSAAGGNVTYRFYGLDRLNGKTIAGTFRGFDIGTAVVANGAADFTFDEDLAATEGAIETVADGSFLTGEVTSVPVVLSQNRQVTPNPLAAGFSPQQVIITGEDGVDYYIGGGVEGAGGDGDNLKIHRVSDGVVAIDKAEADVFTDAESAGIVPVGGSVGSPPGHNIHGIPIPETPYIIVVHRGDAGVSTDRRVLYYKINSSGVLELVGGYAGRTDGLDVLFSPLTGPGNQIRGAGHVIAQGTDGDNNSIPFKYPYAIAFIGFRGSPNPIRSSIVVLPSINYILQNSPITENIPTPWLIREQQLSTVGYGNNIFDVQNGPNGSSTRSRGFFLPRPDFRGSRFFQMFYRGDLIAHDAGTATVANSFLTANATANLTGLVSSVEVRLNPVLTSTDGFGFQASLTNMEVSSNARFVQADGSTAAFPFPDDGQNFDDTGDFPNANFYGNPSVYPSDINDPMKPWLLFFPRYYRNNAGSLGVRIFQWDPRREKAFLVDFERQAVFTPGSDGTNADTNPIEGVITWDRATGKIRMTVSGAGSGQKSITVLEFGNFVPENASVVEAQAVDGILGCAYTSRLQLLRPQEGAGARNGLGALGKTRRVDQYGILVDRSGPMDLGTDFDRLFTIDYNETDKTYVADATTGRFPLASGEFNGTVESTYNFANMIIVQQDNPLPGNIVSIAGFSNAADR